MITVTKPYMPPLEEFMPYLEKIWESKNLTNNGEFHQQLEKELANFLGVPFVSLFSNGTLGLISALQTLRITGEVITTPYSFVATSHSLRWNGIKPVFCDVDPDFLNLDPKKIEAAITPKTTAIMPVHVYGTPCDVDAIQKIADTYGLKVIYDAAHAFGVNLNGESILNYGDLSVISFHATKVFNTFEGGAIICKDEKTKQRIDFLKNFGFADETTVVAPGINAKMNEMQSAFGLLQLQHIDRIISDRKSISDRYDENLKGIKGLKPIPKMEGVNSNYGYYPILIDANEYGKSRDELYFELRDKGIYGRRYFYPLISDFPTYRAQPSSQKENLVVASKASDQVICLPIYPELEMDIVDKVSNIISSF